MRTEEPDNDAEGQLDRLLGEARWEEPGNQRVDRLQHQWHALSRRQRMRRMSVGLTLAASLLLTATLVWRHVTSGPAAPTLAEREPVGAGVVEPHKSSSPRSIVEQSLVREPNEYERLVLGAAFGKPVARRQAKAKPPASERVLDTLLADEMASETGAADPATAAAEITRLLSDPQTDLAQIETRLWGVIAQRDEVRRPAAVRLLARIGTQRSLPMLVELTREPPLHETALLGVARLASDAQLARLATIEPAAPLRQRLAAMLLERRTGEATARYLELVENAAARRDALEAVREMADPPLELLCEFLESPRGEQRLAAAVALAQSRDPGVTERLSTFVFRDTSRQGALVALVLSRSPQAKRFLDAARHDLYLVAAVQAAEYQIQSLSEPSGGKQP